MVLVLPPSLLGAPDLLPPILGLGSPGRADQTQDLGRGAAPQGPLRDGVGVPSPLPRPQAQLGAVKRLLWLLGGTVR